MSQIIELDHTTALKNLLNAIYDCNPGIFNNIESSHLGYSDSHNAWRDFGNTLLAFNAHAEMRNEFVANSGNMLPEIWIEFSFLKASKRDLRFIVLNGTQFKSTDNKVVAQAKAFVVENWRINPDVVEMFTLKRIFLDDVIAKMNGLAHYIICHDDVLKSSLIGDEPLDPITVLGNLFGGSTYQTELFTNDQVIKALHQLKRMVTDMNPNYGLED